MTCDYLSIEAAAEILERQVNPPAVCEYVPLNEAVGRICFEQLSAVMDQPPFNRSPLDGYAMLHRDIATASPEQPAALRVARCVFAGDAPGPSILSGEAIRIMTGAPIPPGADCVIRQEDTDCGEHQVQIYRSLRANDNICSRGEDMSTGLPIIAQGEKLSAAHIGVLAGQGFALIPVFPRPKIGLLATGDELVTPGTPLSEGKIYNSNLYYLSARITELGMRPVLDPCGGDDPEGLATAVKALLGCCDAVITTGGVSVGLRDYMPQVCNLLDAQELFHGVAVKPGSPVLAMSVAGKPVVCLSGNPFAAAATLELVARPMLGRLAGWHSCAPRRASGVLDSYFGKSSPSRRLVRAQIENGRVSLPTGRHVSGALSALIGCNCLIDIPAGSPTLPPETPVEVVLL